MATIITITLSNAGGTLDVVRTGVSPDAEPPEVGKLIEAAIVQAYWQLAPGDVITITQE